MLTAVNPEYLHDVWGWVSERLAEMKARFKSEWLPEDVYAAVKTGQATLYTIGADDGFVIAQRQLHPAGPVLFIWALWGRNALAANHAEIQGELDALAKRVGAHKIVMHSPRKGWARKGFRAREIIYEREV